MGLDAYDGRVCSKSLGSLPPHAHVFTLGSRLFLRAGQRAGNYVYEVDEESSVETTRCDILDSDGTPAGSAVYSMRAEPGRERQRHEFRQIARSGLAIRAARWTTGKP